MTETWEVVIKKQEVEPLTYSEMLASPGVYKSNKIDTNHRIISFGGQAIDNIMNGDWTKLHSGGKEFVRITDETCVVSCCVP
jgi:hypothetical protein